MHVRRGIELIKGVVSALRPRNWCPCRAA